MNPQESYIKQLQDKITKINFDIARNSDNDYIVERHTTTRTRLEKRN